jgi:hypothetical protein
MQGTPPSEARPAIMPPSPLPAPAAPAIVVLPAAQEARAAGR